MTDYLNAWQCIGCGRIEAPQNCIGVCQDARVQFVYAKDYEAALLRAEAGERALELVRKLASVTPTAESFRQSYLTLQREARRIVAEAQSATAEAPAAQPEYE